MEIGSRHYLPFILMRLGSLGLEIILLFLKRVIQKGIRIKEGR